MTPVNRWQRVSPVALLYFLVKNLPHLANLWPLLLGVWVAGEDFQSWFLNRGIHLVVFLILLAVSLKYWFFRFKLDGDRIHLQSGVVRRTRLTLEFDRVQEADIAEPFYFRPFGLATLGLESAGSSQQEVHIPGLPLTQAKSIKALILAHRQAQRPDAATAEAAQPDDAQAPDYELRLPRAEAARFGLMNNGLLIFLPLMAPVIQNGGAQIERWLASLDDHLLLQLLPAADDERWAWMVAGGLLVATVAMVLIFAVSALIALVRYWDYRLTRKGDQYQYRAGLMNIKTRSFRAHKLQMVSVSQGIFARMLHRYSVHISKAGSVMAGPQDNQRFLVPVLTAQSLAELKQQLNLPQEPVWARVHGLQAVHSALAAGTTFFVLVAVVLLLMQQSFLPALVSYPLYAVIAWRRWQCLGYFYNGEWLAIKTGFIGHQVQWLPVVKNQKLRVSTSLLLRPWGLAHLHIWGASGKLSLPFVPMPFAETVRDQVIDRVASFKGRWL